MDVMGSIPCCLHHFFISFFLCFRVKERHTIKTLEVHAFLENIMTNYFLTLSVRICVKKRTIMLLALKQKKEFIAHHSNSIQSSKEAHISSKLRR